MFFLIYLLGVYWGFLVVGFKTEGFASGLERAAASIGICSKSKEDNLQLVLDTVIYPQFVRVTGVWFWLA